MRYRCANCGAELEEDEVKTIEDPRGEFWGMPCSETIYVCPVCGTDALEEEDKENED
jgi:hypothetical protein